jgi:hypothetical protein
MSLPNSRRQSHGGITITSGVEEMSLPNSRRQSHGGITITSGVEEMSLPNSGRQSHGGITITSGVEEMSLPNSRRQSHGGITIKLKRSVESAVQLSLQQQICIWNKSISSPVRNAKQQRARSENIHSDYLVPRCSVFNSKRIRNLSNPQYGIVIWRTQ